MKRFTKVLVMIFLTTMLFAQYVAPPVSVSAAAADPLVYDGIDYTGGISNRNGGTGWSGAWQCESDGGTKNAFSISSGLPLIYTDGANFLNTTGRYFNSNWSYRSVGRFLDLSYDKPLKDYTIYTPSPAPGTTPAPATGLIGKPGTKLWGSHIQSIGMPAGLDVSERSVEFKSTALGATLNGGANSTSRVTVGYFGANSRVNVTGNAYVTVRVYATANPIVIPAPTTNTGDSYYYDATNKFLYIRVLSKQIGTSTTNIPYKTYFLAYNFDYTDTTSTFNLYVNPTLSATAPASPDATITTPITLNDMRFRAMKYVGTEAYYKAVFDEIRLGATYESVNPFSATVPQPTVVPNLGAKVSWAPGASTPPPTTVVDGPRTQNGKFLVDGITSDNSKMTGEDYNVGFAAYHTINLPSAMQVGGVKVFSGQTGTTLGKENPSSYSITYFNGTTWEMVPGTDIIGNIDSERVLVFSQPVYTSKIRINNNSQGGGVPTNFREIEIYKPATTPQFSQTFDSPGAPVFTDDFTSIDYAKWSILGATPSAQGDATPPPFQPTATTPANPTPAPNYRPQIVDDSQSIPLNWYQVTNSTPMPTTAPTWRPDFYANDGKALFLTPATTYYAFRSTTSLPSNKVIEFGIKGNNDSNSVYTMYFNESGTTSTGTLTNGYRLDVFGASNNAFGFELKKVVNGNTTYLDHTYANFRGYYYYNMRLIFNNGTIKLYQNDPDSGLMQLLSVSDST
ncbi:MAG: discoidin domain-containing protein, partial [Clostridia bacterium]